MNDMSRPQQSPTTAEHAHHDALLVARLAADDPLDEADYGQALALVSSCTSCAALAADLRTVAAAIAWEPVPPRRRDFRLSPEQAEQARGSGLQRLMRRLSRPQSNGLRPLAAGVMSLGLVLVVAGSFWPPDVFDGTVQQEVSAPSTFSAPIDAMTSATTPPSEVGEQDFSLELEPGASIQLPPADDSASTSGDGRAQASAAAAVVDAAADGAAGPALESSAEEVGADTSRSDVGARQLESSETNSLTQELAAPEMAAKASSPVVEAFTEAAAEAQLQSASPAAAGADVAVMAESAENVVAADTLGAVAADSSSGDRAELANAPDDATSIETVLVAVGLGLFFVGLSLWLLVWMTRRRDRDPLAR